MRDELLEILDRKLFEAVRAADSRAEAAVRGALDDVGPNPNSPFVGEVMGAIGRACENGYRDRAEVARRVVQETLSPYRLHLTAKDGERILKVVAGHFPADKYVDLVGHTPGVYARRQAGHNKFQQGDFDLQFALVKASAHDMSIHALSAITSDVGETILRSAHSRGATWKRLLGTAWTSLARPIIKWVAGIVAVLLAGYISWYFGLR